MKESKKIKLHHSTVVDLLEYFLEVYYDEEFNEERPVEEFLNLAVEEMRLKLNKELAKNDIDVISIYESGISLEEYFKSIVKEAE